MDNQTEALKAMISQTISSAQDFEIGSQDMSFTTVEGNTIRFYHSQSCCESVSIESIDGDIEDLVGSPLVLCEAVDSENVAAPEGRSPDSFTWTFYKFATVKGYVTVRWFGSSSGYYSERVSIKYNDEYLGS